MDEPCPCGQIHDIEADETFIICGLAAFVIVPQKGWKLGSCTRCAELVWASKKARQVIEVHPDVVIYCPNCVPTDDDTETTWREL